MNVQRAFKRNVPHYVLRQSSSACSCDIDSTCDCMPDLYLTENGYTGFGSAFWTYADETCPANIADSGKAYYCNFLGLQPFWAMGEDDAAETIRKVMDLSKIAVNVNFKNNKRADEVLARIQEEAKTC